MSDEDMSSRARHWCFTLNNYTEEQALEAYYSHWGYKYLVFGKEVADTGTPHLQGYVSFPVKVSFTKVTKLLPRAHWEVSRGTPAQASIYCKKENDFVEVGTLPAAKHAAGVEAAAAKHRKVWELAKTGDHDAVAEYCPRSALVHFKSITLIGAKYRTCPPVLLELNNLWVWGTSGVGKSRTAWEIYPDAFEKPVQHKWWDGYNFEETVIMDDIDPQHHYQAHNLKIWLDHRPFRAEIKGGAIRARPLRFIITSQYPPEAVFKDAESLEAVKRRCSVLHLLKYTPGKFV